jgi:hypothetical protein
MGSSTGKPAVEFASYARRIRDLTPNWRRVPADATPFKATSVSRNEIMVFNIADYGHTLMNDFFIAGGQFRRAEFQAPRRSPPCARRSSSPARLRRAGAVEGRHPRAGARPDRPADPAARGARTLDRPSFRRDRPSFDDRRQRGVPVTKRAGAPNRPPRRMMHRTPEGRSVPAKAEVEATT